MLRFSEKLGERFSFREEILVQIQVAILTKETMQLNNNEIVALRNKLITAIAIQENLGEMCVTPHPTDILKTYLVELGDYLQSVLKSSEYREILNKDAQRQRSIGGMIKSQKMRVAPIKNFEEDLNKVLSGIRLQYI